MRKALENMPPTLDATYERILSNIPEETKEDSLRVLEWICFSTRPMRLCEIMEVPTVILDDEPRVDPERRPFRPLDVLTLCPGLITTEGSAYQGSNNFNSDDADNADNDGSKAVIKLAHYSISEYLTSKRIGQSQISKFAIAQLPASISIAKTCLVYLLQFHDVLTFENPLTFPLARYAAQNWWQHYRAVSGKEINSALLSLAMQVLGCPNCLGNSMRLYNPDEPWEQLHTGNHGPFVSPLYYVSNLGLSDLVECLLKKGNIPSLQGGLYGTALQATVYQGHKKVVEQLLQAGADVNLQGGKYGTALQAASCKGYEKVVEQLLQAGADVNLQGGGYGTALQAASCEGYEKVVEQLLQAGADVNLQGGEYGTALQAASCRGHEKVVEQLLQAGADVNLQGGGYGTALQAASCEGYEKVVEQLLQAGADVNLQGGDYGTALQAASCWDYEKIVEQLLQAGADVNLQGGRYGSALGAARVRWNRGTAVQLLLEHGARDSEADKAGDTSQSD